MTISNAQVGVPVLFTTTSNCSSACDSVCADFTIKRHDTYPPFRVSAEDCSGPLDLSDPNLLVEISMWTTANLKYDLAEDPTVTTIRLAGDVGFDQVMVNDIIVMDRARLPEYMLVVGFDENDKLIEVVRGYHGTPVGLYKKGSSMKVFRILNQVGTISTVTGTQIGIDGSTQNNALMGTYLVYDWAANDTCLAGCYMLEFKLIQMSAATVYTELPQDNYASIMPSTMSFTPSTLKPIDFGCGQGLGVVWIRRFPVDRDGFVIKIIESPTSENLY